MITKILLSIILASIVWYQAIKPVIGEVYYMRHKRAVAAKDFREAERDVLQALEWNPENTLFCSSAAQFYLAFSDGKWKAGEYITEALDNFNGDATLYSLYYLLGVQRFKVGDLYASREAFQRALHYNPKFTIAQEKLAELERIIAEHGQILIKLR